MAGRHVYGLVDAEGNWAAFAAPNDDGVLFCVWPHPRYAEACATGDWDGRESAPMELGEFIDQLLPDLIREGSMVAVLPTNETAVPVEPERLLRDVAIEIGRQSTT